MKFALLGCNEHALPLLRALREEARAKDHEERSEMVAAFQIPDEFLPEVRSLSPRAHFDDEWEALLHGTLADAVIVTGKLEDDSRSDQLRKLSQSLPVVMVQPCCEAIVGYELDMIRSDTQLPIVPYVPGRYHPLVQKLANMVAGKDDRIGEIRQVVFAASCSSADREDVLTQFCRDVAIIRAATGHLTELIATGVTYGDTNYGGLSVNFSCQQDLSVRWSVGPLGSTRQLLLVGESGSAGLDMSNAPDQWRISSEQFDDDHTGYDWPGDELRTVMSLCREKEQDLWLNGCRDLEAADTVDYSLRRGRKISLISEAPSEEGTFKGLMAAGGCLLLLLSFLAIIGLSMVEGFRYPGKRSEWESRHPDGKKADEGDVSVWPLPIRIWPVYPLLIFLLLQIFRLAAKPARNSGQSTAALPASDDDSPP